MCTHTNGYFSHLGSRFPGADAPVAYCKLGSQYKPGGSDQWCMNNQVSKNNKVSKTATWPVFSLHIYRHREV